MSKQTHQVVVLHGLGRSSRSMKKLAKALSRRGYRVFNLNYKGITGSYNSILSELHSELESLIDPTKIVHFVGHSFGGILIRGILVKETNWTFGRAVMLGTPNKGTETAKYISRHAIFKWFTPKVAKELTPDSHLIQSLAEPTIETGIIAGSQQFSYLVPVTWFYKKATNNAAGDGVVEIINTQCSNMSDFLELPLHHSFMMWDSQVIEQTLYFLGNGRFNR